MKKHRFIAIISLMLLAGCAETSYVGFQRGGVSPDLFTRQVEFEVSKAFYREPPACVIVLPFTSTNRKQRWGWPRIVEGALARQLSGKVTRVIGPNERDQLIRRLSVDLSRSGDRRVLANQARCEFFAQAKPWGEGSVYAVFWAQTRVGLEVKMMRSDDDNVVWQARHEATRSGGGLPLSPLSIATKSFMATRFNADGDVPLSLLDDALRRMVNTIPDTRYTM